MSTTARNMVVGGEVGEIMPRDVQVWGNLSGDYLVSNQIRAATLEDTGPNINLKKWRAKV